MFNTSRNAVRRVALLSSVAMLVQVLALLVTPSAFAAAPTITGFSPASGPVGTSVTVTGTGFTGAKRVLFNGRRATFTVVSDTQITTTVPAGATDGPIKVRVPGQGIATSSTSFNVTTQPAPTISGFTPTSGPPGTSVVITGANFTGASSVQFAGTTATFTVNSATQITATVPTGATTGSISVTSASGTGTSSTSFTVTAPPPSITSFSPSSGCVTSTVTLTGTGFTGATAVRVNGLSTTFTVVSATRITAAVPLGATTGPISVTGPGGTGTSSTNFTVLHCEPIVSSFSPATGPVGATVIITGDDFTGTTTVKFGTVSASFTVNSDAQITATVPIGATTGKIAVTNAVGTGASSTDFIVTAAPTITSFSPTIGGQGSVVTINGTNFTATTFVGFNGAAAASFTVVSTTKITATVPVGATTGRITVMNSAGTATSATDFTVLPPSTITSFTPTQGRVGRSVILTGTNLGDVTSVRFNGTQAVFTINSPTEIATKVPAGATDGPITVEGQNGIASSSADFNVINVYARSVTLSLKRHLRASGLVVSADDIRACENGVKVRIQRRRDGRWRTLKTVETDGAGRFSTGLRDRRGRYRARVVKTFISEDICRPTTSPVRRHTH